MLCMIYCYHVRHSTASESLDAMDWYLPYREVQLSICSGSHSNLYTSPVDSAELIEIG
jgi:hypothetical protein